MIAHAISVLRISSKRGNSLASSRRGKQLRNMKHSFLKIGREERRVEGQKMQQSKRGKSITLFSAYAFVPLTPSHPYIHTLSFYFYLSLFLSLSLSFSHFLVWRMFYHAQQVRRYPDFQIPEELVEGGWIRMVGHNKTASEPKSAFIFSYFPPPHLSLSLFILQILSVCSHSPLCSSRTWSWSLCRWTSSASSTIACI